MLSCCGCGTQFGGVVSWSSAGVLTELISSPTHSIRPFTLPQWRRIRQPPWPSSGHSAGSRRAQKSGRKSAPPRTESIEERKKSLQRGAVGLGAVLADLERLGVLDIGAWVPESRFLREARGGGLEAARGVLPHLLLALALVCLIVAMANRAPVTLSLLPDDLAGLLNWQLRVELPLFLVLALGVVLGLALGFVWEWLREHKHRKVARVQTRAVSKLERELAAMKDQTALPEDPVLALLEKPKGSCLTKFHFLTF